MRVKKSENKWGHIYLLKSVCGTYYKYGCSKHIKTRLRAINYKNPYGAKFELIKSFETKDYYAKERRVYWSLPPYRGNGEYLLAADISEKKIIKIISNIVRAK